VSFEHEYKLYTSRGKPYEQGVALLEKWLNKPYVIQLLQSGESSYTRQELNKHLEQLQKKIGSGKPTPKKQARGLSPQVKATLKKLEAERKDKWLRCCTLHAGLTLVENHDKRRELAFEILSLRADIVQLWYLNDYVVANGHLPEQKPDGPLLVVDFMRSYENARINVGKAQRKLKGANTPEEKAKAEKMLTKHQMRFDTLEAIRLKGQIVYD